MDEFTNDDGSLNLRERRRRATSAEISEAALALFEQKGMAATTVHEIAQAAGVSDRTCFRYLSSKEEAVLTIAAEFDEPLKAWLANIDPDRAVLPQLEEVYAAVLADFDGPLASIARQHLRVRRLMDAEPQLRAAAVSIDAANAGVALRESFNEWSESMDAGTAVTLAGVYRAKRLQLQEIARTSQS
jgi:AcrR family transcriptional regulator